MATITVSLTSYRKVLAYGLHRAIKDDCLDEFLSRNDVSEVLFKKVNQISVLGRASMKGRDRDVLTLLKLGVVPLGVSCDHYDEETRDLRSILKYCALETYYRAVDALMQHCICTELLYDNFLDVFAKVHKNNGLPACRYFMEKLASSNRLTCVLNYCICIPIATARRMYKKNRCTMGFQILFETGIDLNISTGLETLKELLDTDPKLRELYNSSQVPIKEPNVD
jgi:hypothetical protein